MNYIYINNKQWKKRGSTFNRTCTSQAYITKQIQMSREQQKYACYPTKLYLLEECSAWGYWLRLNFYYVGLSIDDVLNFKNNFKVIEKSLYPELQSDPDWRSRTMFFITHSLLVQDKGSDPYDLASHNYTTLWLNSRTAYSMADLPRSTERELIKYLAIAFEDNLLKTRFEVGELMSSIAKDSVIGTGLPQDSKGLDDISELCEALLTPQTEEGKKFIEFLFKSSLFVTHGLKNVTSPMDMHKHDPRNLHLLHRFEQ